MKAAAGRPVPQTEKPRTVATGEDGQPQGRAGCGGRLQDHRAKGAAHRQHRLGQGQVDRRLGLVLRALGHGWQVGIVQFIKGAWDTGERHAIERFPDHVRWYSMGEGFTWETQDRARDIAAASAAWAKAQELMADPADRLVVLDELNIALRYDYLPLMDVVQTLKARRTGPARRRHRPQRQAGADRGRRSRDRDDAGEAPLRGRREGAAGHRVLRMRRAAPHSFRVGEAEPGPSLFFDSEMRDAARLGPGLGLRPPRERGAGALRRLSDLSLRTAGVPFRWAVAREGAT